MSVGQGIALYVLGAVLTLLILARTEPHLIHHGEGEWVGMMILWPAVLVIVTLTVLYHCGDGFLKWYAPLPTAPDDPEQLHSPTSDLEADRAADQGSADSPDKHF